MRRPRPPTKPPVAASQPPAETEEALVQRLGPVTAVPMVVGDVTKVSLDHRAAFVLRFLDGMATIDDILDASGLPRVEALRILDELHQRRVIALR